MRQIFCVRFQNRVSLALLLLVTSCVPFSFAQKSSQETFPSAEQASRALFRAVQSNDEADLTHVLGCGKDLVSSGDNLQDQHDRDLFIQKYEQMHRLVEEPDGTTLLYVGAENWPFPVPLVLKGGNWFFDADAGADEVTYRRVGENEADAIDTGISLRTSGEVPSGESHGYYFRKLPIQGKDGTDRAMFIAYPAGYRSSGVLTFVITPKAVFEKDLGPQTASLAKSTTTWKKDRSWHRAQ
jgi:hypothetical protein